jgi:hypothetical protein
MTLNIRWVLISGIVSVATTCTSQLCHLKVKVARKTAYTHLNGSMPCRGPYVARTVMCIVALYVMGHTEEPYMGPTTAMDYV